MHLAVRLLKQLASVVKFLVENRILILGIF